MAGDKEPAPQDGSTLGTLLRSSSLSVGLATGTCGLLYGSLAGTYINTPHRTLYPLFSGAQWFCAGTCGFYVRSTLLTSGLNRDNNLHLVAASGAAGVCSGAVAGAFLPRGAIFRGGILFGILATAAQAGLNFARPSEDEVVANSAHPQGNRLAQWIPMKSLSDDEYEDIIQGKLLRVEAEIALLDDQIAQLRRAQAAQPKAANTSST